MTVTPRLAAAVEVFRELGWTQASPDDVATLPAGTPEQQRTARDGLATGEWGEWGRTGPNTYGWISWVDVDRDMLGAFAVRVGVDARQAARVLPGTERLSDEQATRLLATRGPRFAEQFVEAACRSNRRAWEHATSAHAGAAVRLVDLHDLPVPRNVEYLKDWSVYALGALTGEGELFPQSRGWCEPAVVTRRLAEHVRAGIEVGCPATGPFGAVVPEAVARGLLPRDETLALVLTALDAAQRPGDRTVWVRVLTGPLALTDDELLAHADAFVTVLAHGDGPVVELLAPRLIRLAPQDVLGDVLAVTLPTRTKKLVRVLLGAAAERARPADHVVEAVAPLVLPHVTGTDRQLARAARTLADAWAMEPGPDSAPDDEARGLWRPTPPLWTVPRLELGPVTAEALTASAAALTGRPEGVVDVEVERFLALANAVARDDVAAARTALGGVRHGWVGGLRCVPEWVAGEPNRLLDRPANPAYTDARATVWGPAEAREAAVMQRLGEAPVLLSTPTWVDLRIDPADLVDRLREYRAAGATVSEGDLYLALTRSDPTLATPEVLEALVGLTVPVVLQSGSTAPVTAGPAVRDYLLDPLVEPPLEVTESWRQWSPAARAVPASLGWLPARIDAESRFDFPGLDEVPTWGDAAATHLGHSESAEIGLLLRQAVRRATPLPPGLAVNLIGAQRVFHHAAAPDGTAAVHEAWERGLLRPGVPDVRLLDWRETPSNLAALARACDELAAEGLLSVVWPVLDGVLTASLRAPRMLAGTAEVVEAMQRLLPEVRAAVAGDLAGPAALALPGARALAERAGSSRAVTAARALVAQLPALPPTPETAPETAPAEVPAPAPATGRSFDEIWPAGAGSAPAVDDGAVLTAQWADTSGKQLALDLTLPHEPHGPFRVIKGWFYDLEHEGQCAAVALPVPEGARGAQAWLRWDADAGRLVVSSQRNWRGGTDGPLDGGPVAPLTTSMVAAVLASLCHADGGTYHQHHLVTSGLFGSAAVAAAMRALLPHPDVSPARMVKLLESDPTTLPVLWPVLAESVRHAAELPGAAPRWLNRVLDVTLLHAAALRTAADRALIPAAAAAWPGLAALAARPGSSAVPRKARTLVAALLDTDRGTPIDAAGAAARASG
ncbi:DUF7824 domain-containing protein [Cellulomonas gilvus]|uniref:DUF7824 domain-containing protein n=1 Tax=Cellulomonas gilvus (strain ATCC 13127 / NRRL B-14078) TaxID=593907 RepID=F8A137_CELGA|nr:DUF6493 family protein [Cellulomonas gilvus]AEI12795.1 hypothetical protein Celgi_2295 [Cellulomonas gilvus ATCC 13127]